MRRRGDELSVCPFEVADDVLFVAYYASAESSCFDMLGWPRPRRVFDLFAEFRCFTNGVGAAHGLGLIGALMHYGLPTIDDLIRLDRKRKGMKLSNEDWTSKTDPDAKIAKMKDGSTHLAYKPEHAVDLDTGVIVAASIHEAGKGDTATLDPTLEEAEKNCPPLDLRRHRKTLAISSPTRATTRVTF